MKRTLPPHKSRQSEAARIFKSPQKLGIEKQKHNADVNQRATFRNWLGRPNSCSQSPQRTSLPLSMLHLSQQIVLELLLRIRNWESSPFEKGVNNFHNFIGQLIL